MTIDSADYDAADDEDDNDVDNDNPATLMTIVMMVVVTLMTPIVRTCTMALPTVWIIQLDLINMRNTVEATHQDMLAHPAQISQAKYV